MGFSENNFPHRHNKYFLRNIPPLPTVRATDSDMAIPRKRIMKWLNVRAGGGPWECEWRGGERGVWQVLWWTCSTVSPPLHTCLSLSLAGFYIVHDLHQTLIWTPDTASTLQLHSRTLDKLLRPSIWPGHLATSFHSCLGGSPQPSHYNLLLERRNCSFCMMNISPLCQLCWLIKISTHYPHYLTICNHSQSKEIYTLISHHHWIWCQVSE